MNEFISPHQNININISYNLGQEKVPQVVFGKKLKKNAKGKLKEGEMIQGQIQQGSTKSKNKLEKLDKMKKLDYFKEFQESRDHQPKKISEKKLKSKVKKNQHLVTYADFENIYEGNRRIRTQGSINATDIFQSMNKKQKKPVKQAFQANKSASNHFKSVQPTFSNTKPKKALQKQISQPVAKQSVKDKEKQRNMNKSCTFQSKKAQLISNNDHFTSMTSNTLSHNYRNSVHHNMSKNGSASFSKIPKRKERSQSAHLIKGDKFVSRLLDMSVITSELGGSVIVAEEPKITKILNIESEILKVQKENRNYQNLKDFMSSIDIRVVKNMQDDSRGQIFKKRAFFGEKSKSSACDFTRTDGIDLITYLNKIKRISLQKLNKCATVIQTFWRQKTKETVVSYYSSLFKNVAIGIPPLSEFSKISVNDDEASLNQDIFKEQKNMQEIRQLYHFQEGDISEQYLSISKKLINHHHQNNGQFEFYDSEEQGSPHHKLTLSQLNVNYHSIESQSEQIRQSQEKIKKQEDFSENNNDKYVSNFMEVISTQAHHKENQKSYELKLSKNEEDEPEDEEDSEVYEDENEENDESSEEYINLNQIKKSRDSESSEAVAKVMVKRKYGENIGNYYYAQMKRHIDGSSSDDVSADIAGSDSRCKMSEESLTNSKKLMKKQGKKHKVVELQDYQLQKSVSNYQEEEDLKGEKSLNIQKYRELVRKTLEQNQEQKNKFNKKITEKKYEKYASESGSSVGMKSYGEGDSKRSKESIKESGEESVHWNQVHKMLSTNMGQKVPSIPKSILQELMKQSAYNKQWVDGQFSKDSLESHKRVSGEDSPLIHPLKCQQEESAEKEEEVEWNKINLIEIKHSNSLKNDIQPEEDEQPPSFNWNKYSELSKIHKKSFEQEMRKKNSVDKEVEENQLPGGILPSIDESEENSVQNSEKKWVDEHMSLESGAVQDYLNCGLDSFGLKIHGAIRNNSQENNANENESIFSNEDENDEHDNEDVYVFANGAERIYQDNNRVVQGPSSEQQNDSHDFYHDQEKLISDQLNQKRKENVSELILIYLMEELSFDISNLLKKSQQANQNNLPHHQQLELQPVPVAASSSQIQANQWKISTNFQSIRDFITRLKQFILGKQEYIEQVISNIKNNIGPTSLEILSYLRMQPEECDEDNMMNEEGQENINEGEEQNEEEWLFVIPNNLFEEFHKMLLEEKQQMNEHPLHRKFKYFTEFWHRGIFECYNQCLDFQRPFGITGSPYSWIIEPKLPKIVNKNKIVEILENAEGRLLEMSCSTSGIIFDKPDSPYRDSNLSEQMRIQINEDRISRMLASDILDEQYNWITYNDQITQIQVQISRRLQQILIFQLCTQIKRINRRRKAFLPNKTIQYSNQSNQEQDQHVNFELQQI